MAESGEGDRAKEGRGEGRRGAQATKAVEVLRIQHAERAGDAPLIETAEQRSEPPKVESRRGMEGSPCALGDLGAARRMAPAETEQIRETGRRW